MCSLRCPPRRPEISQGSSRANQSLSGVAQLSYTTLRKPYASTLSNGSRRSTKARRIPGLPSSDISGPAPSNKMEGAYQSKLETGRRLLTLPRELRFRILSYTDLITPLKEVEWSRDSGDSGTFVALYPRCRILRRLRCPPHIRHGRRFFNCWAASHSKPGIGCFCQVRHSAASSTCMFWAPPTALFPASLSQTHLFPLPVSFVA